MFGDDTMNGQTVSNLIRSKTDIVDIIGERIPLVKKGKNFFGICPFHDDTNPSMSVSREKQIYTCFTCHATGNVFKFLMDYEKMSFPEALKYLGDRVGVDTNSVRLKKVNNNNDKYYEMYDFATKYYQNNILSPAGSMARTYLSKRGIDKDIIKKFEIGLSLPNNADLTELLLKKKYDIVDLNKAGLTNSNYDVYKDRIMFPLFDINGKVVGFSGRIYKDSQDNKYLNTKETPIFVKGEQLYNYHIAKEKARILKYVIIMEGFMDVIRASTIGYENVIALMGTALTHEQMKLIKRLSNNIILCLDGDNPGKAAAYKLGEEFLKEKIEVKVVTLPNNDDPDSFILKEGKEKFARYIEEAENYNDYKIRVMRDNVNFQSDIEKANYINNVLKELTEVNDEIRIEIILKKLAKEFNLGYNTLEKKFSNIKNNKPQEEIKFVPKNTSKRKDKYRQAIEQVIYYMLTNEWVISEVDKERLLLPDDKIRILVQEIIYYYKTYGAVSIADFYTYLQDKQELLETFNSILNSNYNDEVSKEVLYLYFDVIRENVKNKEIKRLEEKLVKEIDPLEQAKLADMIRKLRIGESNNG
ncbi:DNA primase [human gut metagenome]|jgi:DNA primase|uniref:DNA primase n=1 Tax=human gut metagenome TaxID=408170 RepID=K1RL59_9ZZZZ